MQTCFNFSLLFVRKFPFLYPDVVLPITTVQLFDALLEKFVIKFYDVTTKYTLITKRQGKLGNRLFICVSIVTAAADATALYMKKKMKYNHSKHAIV